jgi:hypothetical protein
MKFIPLANTPSPYFLLAEFGELQEATLSPAMSAFSLSFRMEKLGGHWIDLFEYFSKICRETATFINN